VLPRHGGRRADLGGPAPNCGTANAISAL